MDNGGGAGARNGLGFWDIWDPGRWSAAAAASPCSNFPDNAVVPTGGGDHHHLTCLKLGKRQYYGGDGTAAAAATGSKRERPPQPTATAMSGPPPRCQVADCDKVLWDAKEYHRRHKVCEAHSKAPRVVVLGSVQRFCQQCSRFHAISEFDDSKRSCRRRLAGHNERRRKSSGGGAAAVTNSEYIIVNPPSLESTAEVSRFAYESSRSRALSLLSSKASPWISTPDLPSRSSAALRELIAENRAATLAHQLISEHGCWRDNISPMQHKREPQSHRAPTSQLANIWNLQLQDPGNNLNADIMQMPPGSSLDIFSRIGLL